MNKNDLPKFVMLGSSELRLKGNEYYRDAGMWGVGFRIKGGKLLSSHWRQGHDWLHNVELIPITEEQWKKGNEGYLPDKY